MAHLRDIRALTLEGAKPMAGAAERLASECGMTSAQDAEVAAAGVAAFRGTA